MNYLAFTNRVMVEHLLLCCTVHINQAILTVVVMVLDPPFPALNVKAA